MAVPVVVFLQVVDIDHQDRELVAEPPGPLHFLAKRRLQESIVVDLGQLVGDRELFQPAVEPEGLADDRGLVGEDRQEIHRLASLAVHPKAVDDDESAGIVAPSEKPDGRQVARRRPGPAEAGQFGVGKPRLRSDQDRMAGREEAGEKPGVIQLLFLERRGLVDLRASAGQAHVVRAIPDQEQGHFGPEEFQGPVEYGRLCPLEVPIAGHEPGDPMQGANQDAAFILMLQEISRHVRAARTGDPGVLDDRFVLRVIARNDRVLSPGFEDAGTAFSRGSAGQFPQGRSPLQLGVTDPAGGPIGAETGARGATPPG
ncbi:MAG: hypothetical protein FD129_2500, partial [bacterium]